MTEPKEHRPPDILIALLAGFLIVMAVAAGLFWVASLIVPGGISGLMAALGPGPMSVFATGHIPAAIIGILLLQWRRPALRPAQRIVLEAVTLYFGLAVLIGIFFNYLAASMVGLFD